MKKHRPMKSTGSRGGWHMVMREELRPIHTVWTVCGRVLQGAMMSVEGDATCKRCLRLGARLYCGHPMHDDGCDCGHPPIEGAAVLWCFTCGNRHGKHVDTLDGHPTLACCGERGCCVLADRPNAGSDGWEVAPLAVLYDGGP